jgi:hypothetical protein
MAASSQQQATSNRQQATSNKQQATRSKQQATSNKQQATSNKQRALHGGGLQLGVVQDVSVPWPQSSKDLSHQKC